MSKLFEHDFKPAQSADQQDSTSIGQDWGQDNHEQSPHGGTVFDTPLTAHEQQPVDSPMTRVKLPKAPTPESNPTASTPEHVKPKWYSTRGGKIGIGVGSAAVILVGASVAGLESGSTSHAATPPVATAKAKAGHSPRPSQNKNTTNPTTSPENPSNQAAYGVTKAAGEMFGWNIDTGKAESGSKATIGDIAILNSRADTLEQHGILEDMAIDPNHVDVSQLYNGFTTAYTKAVTQNKPAILGAIGLNVAPENIKPLVPTDNPFIDTGLGLRQSTQKFIKENQGANNFSIDFSPIKGASSDNIMLENPKGGLINEGNLWKQPIVKPGPDGNPQQIISARAVNISVGSEEISGTEIDQWLVVPFKNAATNKTSEVALLYNSYGAQMSSTSSN